MRMAGSNRDKGKATDALDAMVVVVPVIRAADLAVQPDPKQARSLGQKYWPRNLESFDVKCTISRSTRWLEEPQRRARRSTHLA